MPIFDSRELDLAQKRYLDRVIPGWTSWRARWSGGSAQVLELGAGPPVLCIHGGLGEALQWAPVMAALAPRHRMLAVDRPGHGLSDPFDYRGVDIPAHACAFLTGVLDAAGVPSAAVVGASMGGLFAFHLALAHPERVSRLTLVGAAAGMTRDLPRMLRYASLPGLKQLVRAKMRQPTREDVRQFWGQLLVVHPERLADDFLDAATASQRRNTASWFSLLDRVIELGGCRRDLLIRELWPRLETPTTLVWGEQDAWAPPSVGEEIAAAHRNVSVVRIPDAGHAAWVDAPELTSAAIAEAVAPR
jgi:pimeloyl-ACP methyl ester carboxylesterase